MLQGGWPLSEGEIKSLVFQEKIGEGSYGTVHRALLPSKKEIYAVKVVEVEQDPDAFNPKDTHQFKTMEQEINVLRACASCPQIVRTFGVDLPVTKSPMQLLVVMELCEHGAVSDILRKLQGPMLESEICIICSEILRGLKYLHDDKKIHRDVKAGNILIAKNFQPKLADFGISCQLQNTWARRNTVIGSPYWMAPEVIKGVSYNAQADIWSLGITCIEMAECQPPYYHIPPTRAMFVISNKPPTGLTDSSAFSKDLVDFVTGCLRVDTECRPNAVDLLRSEYCRRMDGESSELCRALGETLEPRLRRAPAPQAGGSLRAPATPSRGGSWAARRSPGGTGRVGTSSGPAAPAGAPSAMPGLGVLPLDAATPSVDALARAHAPDSLQQFRRWAADPAGAPPPGGEAAHLDAVADAGAGRPAPAVLTAAEDEDGEGDDDDAEELRRRARDWVNRMVPMQTIDDEPKDLWDSDEEGVETRTRIEAQPEAGAGGPNNGVPFFMQVLGKQWSEA